MEENFVYDLGNSFALRAIKSQSGTGEMERMQSDVDLMREGSIK